MLGISGGQDSTLVGKLVQMSVNELREEGIDCTFIAVKLPYGVQKMLMKLSKLCDSLNQTK